MLTVWFILLVLFPLPEHPIHVSVSEVELSSGRAEWTVRIFKDDFLLALYGRKAKLSILDQPDRLRADILRYLSSHILLFTDGQASNWELKEIHADPEALWMTLTCSLADQPVSTITFINTVLMETYSDQKNIVNISGLKKRSVFIFGKGDGVKKISLLP